MKTTLARVGAVVAALAVIGTAWAHGPTRQKVRESIEINAPPAKVWAAIGNFLRPARLVCPCFRRRAAIARIPHPADGRLPVQSQRIGKKPRPELQKEQLPLQRRTRIFVLLATFPDPPVGVCR